MTDISFGQRLDRRLLKQGFRAGWPLLTLNLITARRMAAAPSAQFAAHRLARPIVTGSEWASYIPKQEGYRAFSPDSFPQLSKIVSSGQSVFARHEAQVTGLKNFNKPYFFNVMTADDLRKYPIFLDFALSGAVTEAVTGYVGRLPRLHSMGIFYSPVNGTLGGSQIFHVDGDGLTQVKCFVNIWEVGTGGGGFTFFPKPLTSRSFRRDGLLKTLTDADVYRTVPEERQIVAKGPPGSGVFVDTSRCLHQGSRATERPRLVFQFQYVSRPDALLPRYLDRATHGGHLHVTRGLLEDIKFDKPNTLMFID